MVKFDFSTSSNVVLQNYIVQYFSAFGVIDDFYGNRKITSCYPSGLGWLLFVFEDLSTGISQKDNQVRLNSKIYIKVSSQKPFDINLFDKNINHFMVVLRPSGLYHLFDIFPGDIENSFNISTDNLNINIFDEIQDRLSEETNHSKKVEIFEDWLLKYLKKSNTFEKKLKYIPMFDFIKNKNLTVAKLSETINISQRQIQKIYLQHTGNTYTTFKLLNQFQMAYQMIVKASQNSCCSDIDFAHIALLCGYSDQSHMIREFKRWAGITPLQLLKKLQTLSIMNIRYFKGTY